MAQTPMRPRRPAPALDPGPRPPVDSWDAAVDDYLDDCRRRNYTPATLGVYASALRGPRMATVNHLAEADAEILPAFSNGFTIERDD